MRRFFFGFFLLTSLGIQAQEVKEDVYDTAKRKDPHHTDREVLYRNFIFESPCDSSMVYHQQYDRIKKDNIGIQSLGDVSTPYIPLSFRPEFNLGFMPGINPYRNIFIDHHDALFFNAMMPYTEFKYAQGKSGLRGMIYFDALHTQNIGKRFNISARYHSTTNDGFYLRQVNNPTKNIQLTSYYQSKNKRYLANAVLSWNKASLMENGGLEQSSFNDSLFRRLPVNVRLVPVNLTNAKSTNRLREHQIMQVYWLKVKYLDDTARTMIPQIGLSHMFSARKQSNYYFDRSGDYEFYDSVYYFNSQFSSDSTRADQYSNELQLFTPLNEKGTSFRAGARYDRIIFYQEAASDNYYNLVTHNISISGQLNFNFLKKFRSELNGNLFLEGYNQGDYFLNWKNNAMIWKDKGISVYSDISTTSRKPYFQQERMISNHYRWENNFDNTRYQSLSFGLDKLTKKPEKYDAFYYSLPKSSLHASVNYSLIDNEVYYSSNAMPAQGGPGQNSLNLYLYKHFDLHRLQIHQELVYQVFSKQLKSILQLPDFISKSSIYLQGFAFKKATFIQFGIDAYYTNSYKARFYNPATQNFQLSDKSVGAYPFLDVFINAEVKTARIFFKMEHFNQDIGGTYNFKNYIYMSPYYPSAPRRFRLGFVWKFYY